MTSHRHPEPRAPRAPAFRRKGARAQRRFVCGTIVVLLGALPGQLPAGDTPDPLAGMDTDLRACVERMLPSRTMVQEQHVTVASGEGWVRESVRTVYWKRAGDENMSVLFVVSEPAAEKGLKVLLVKGEERDPVIYVYSPDTRRARRMVGGGASNSILGTDFTYEDATHFESFLKAASTRRLPDAEFEGQEVFVLETRPVDEASAYASIVTRIDKATCIPLRTEFFGLNGSLDKTLVAYREDAREIQGRWIPMRTVMFNHKRDSRTEFRVSDVSIDLALPDRLFTFAEIMRSQ